MSSRATFLTLALALPLLACESRKSEPIVGPIQLNTQQLQGERVFFRQCNECHPQGQAGLAPSLHDKKLPEFLIKKQVRDPIAFMPEFEEDVISNDDLDALVEYLKVVRQADAEDKTDTGQGAASGADQGG